MNRAETFVLGMTVGAGLVYFLDPDRGNRRRALIRDQVVHAGHELEETAMKTARHVRNRTVGLAHEARAGLTERHVDDRVLEERVRSGIGRTVSDAAAIEITARDGHITLSGDVSSRDVQELVRTARSVRGVNHVTNRLHVYAQADGRPGMEGARGS
jgi:osmotically-inducible protein OsmY